jgi:methylated-DNA-[protein]-cysteine S-methyltransferase
MRFCLVDTEIGPFGLAWSQEGLARVLLPEHERGPMLARLLRIADPATTAQLPRFLMDLIEGYGRGQRADFSHIQLDYGRAPEINRQVYADILKVGWGETTTYGEIAMRLGDPRLARAVGQALGRNPLPLIVPCHRVLAAGGRMGGFSAPGGAATKRKMLALEGVVLAEPATQLAFTF